MKYKKNEEKKFHRITQNVQQHRRRQQCSGVYVQCSRFVQVFVWWNLFIWTRNHYYMDVNSEWRHIRLGAWRLTHKNRNHQKSHHISIGINWHRQKTISTRWNCIFCQNAMKMVSMWKNDQLTHKTNRETKRKKVKLKAIVKLFVVVVLRVCLCVDYINMAFGANWASTRATLRWMTDARTRSSHRKCK